MTTQIHSSAVIDPDAQLPEDIVIGPFAVIGPCVHIGSGTRIGAHAVIERNTRIGSRCNIGSGAVLGSAPQDREFKDEDTWLEIGSDTQIREYSTLNRGTAAHGTTSVGDRCYIMTYVHIAHDCVVQDGAVLANAVQLAGHVHIEANATVGGLTAIQQFARIGAYAFVGGGSRVRQDVPPYTRAAGDPLRPYGINVVGLTRAGIEPSVRTALKSAYRLLFNSELTTSQAVARLTLDQHSIVPEVQRLVEFVAQTERGVLV